MSHSASKRKSEVGFVAIGGRKLTSRQQSRSRDGKQKSAKKEIKQGALHLQMFAEKREIFVTGLSLTKMRFVANFA